MSRRLNEDADRYCMFWLGIVMMTAYYFEFIFKTSVGWMSVDPVNLSSLFVFPPLITLAFTGYFVPERSKMKNVLLAIAVFFALMYFLASFVVYPWALDDAIWYSFWGIGSAIVVAGGAAMIKITTEDEAYTPGIMDVSKLHYGPPPPEPEPEIEAVTVESSEGEEKSEGEEESAATSEAAD